MTKTKKLQVSETIIVPSKPQQILDLLARMSWLAPDSSLPGTLCAVQISRWSGSRGNVSGLVSAAPKQKRCHEIGHRRYWGLPGAWCSLGRTGLWQNLP